MYVQAKAKKPQTALMMFTGMSGALLVGVSFLVSIFGNMPH